MSSRPLIRICSSFHHSTAFYSMVTKLIILWFKLKLSPKVTTKIRLTNHIYILGINARPWQPILNYPSLRPCQHYLCGWGSISYAHITTFMAHHNIVQPHAPSSILLYKEMPCSMGPCHRTKITEAPADFFRITLCWFLALGWSILLPKVSGRWNLAML